MSGSEMSQGKVVTEMRDLERGTRCGWYFNVHANLRAEPEMKNKGAKQLPGLARQKQRGTDCDIRYVQVGEAVLTH